MDKMEIFNIHSYTGAGEVKFGMSPLAVAAIYGEADDVILNNLKQRVEFRSFMNIGYASGDIECVSHIGFGRQMSGVVFDETKLFVEDESEVLRKLIAADEKPYIYLGFLIFLKLGMTLTGFHNNNIEQKSISMFTRGEWDKRIAKLKPFLQKKK